MTSSITLLRNFLVLGCLLFSTTSVADTEPTELPLFSIEQLEYQGAFRLPANTIGESDVNWANGTLAYNHRNHSIFFVGHNQQQAIAEFSIPELSKATDVSQLNTASVIQGFVRIFNRVTSNPDGQDRITGMYYDYGRLIINTIKYYDAEAKAKNTTLVISDSSNLKDIENLEFYQLEYGAKASGWISAIPQEWRPKLNADLIVGNGNGRPINGRLSIGPSALTVNIRNIVNADLNAGKISLTPLQLFSIESPLSNDLLNKSLTNKTLTELSRPIYGFIVPKTRTYMVLGSSGGHRSGIGYKLQRKNGVCPGFCSNDPNDSTNYYWLWDLRDWDKVIAGLKKPHEIKPYESGALNTTFNNGKFNPIIGATFDNFNNTILLTLGGADEHAGKYKNPPLILIYSISE